MSLNLTICRANEAVELVKRADRLGVPFDAVVSIEHPCPEETTAEQGRAPRMAAEIGTAWADKQIILVCYDVEDDRFGVSPPDYSIVEDAMDFVAEHESTDRQTRVLIHCRSGRARSTALAAVFLVHKNGLTPQQAIDHLVLSRSIAAPNLAIIKQGDAYLGLQGALVSVVEADPEISERRTALDISRARQVESNKFLTPKP